MPNYKYLIVGGGMTGGAAIGGIRAVDPQGSLGVIGAEAHRPYDRPPLSKGLWKGKALETIWREIDNHDVTLHLGRTAQLLDPAKKTVTDDQGNVYRYEKLLLATGGSPRELAFGNDQIIYFRTLDDYARLRALSADQKQVAVIGGGFIGSEIAAALTMNGKSVAMAFPGDGIASHLFPADLSKFLNDYYRQKGVEVLAGEHVTGLKVQAGQSVLKLHNAQSSSEREIAADCVVAGIGILPNVSLAKAAGLEVDNGIRVDAALRTSHADIYAAGDVANFYNPALDRRLRVEHEDNANTMGELAGQSMAGRAVSYDYLPSFYSDLFDLGFEAIGEVDSRLETVTDWKEPFREGVVYYLRDGRVRGVLLWNVWDQVPAARQLIAEAGPFRRENLLGHLPA